MRITWLDGARSEVEEADPALREQIDSELPMMFGDGIPGEAVRFVPGILMVELPCGAEIDFERDGDGVRILFVKI